MPTITARRNQIMLLLRDGHIARRSRGPCVSYTLGPLTVREDTLLKMKAEGLLRIGVRPGEGVSGYIPTDEGLESIEN